MAWSGPLSAQHTTVRVIMAIRATRKWGKMVLIGEGGRMELNPSPDMIHDQKTLVGSWVTSSWRMMELVERLVRWNLHPEDLITHRFPIEKVEEAYSWWLQASAERLLSASTKNSNNLPPIMLKGIHPCISPQLLMTLAEMGHGDEIILADAHFPGHTFNERVIRADGLDVTNLLDGVLPLFELDSYADPLVMMRAVEGDQLEPAVEEQYMKVIHRHAPGAKAPVRIDRFAFYDRAARHTPL